jgi:hypothetical protein
MNRAYELGRERFPWWPDWRGECVAIVASGPSVKKADVAKLRDRIHVVVIKESFELCPWSEVVYGCDASWWIYRKGLPEFKGLKIAHGIQATGQFKNLKRALIKMDRDSMLVDEPMTVGNGGNSGHQALNLVVQFGVTDVILVGFDMRADANHLHWYGRNKWLNANNPMGTNFQRWKKGFDIAKKDLDRMGVTVVNVSPDSQLMSFKRATLDDTLREWGL